jgi:hypothetical protein
MMTLDRDTILGAELHRQKVAVPEWGRMVSENGEAHVYVREMRGNELDQFLKLQGKSETELTLMLCVMCVCDAGGTPIFQPEDKPKLAHGPLAPLQRCATAAMKMNGLMAEEDDEEGN